MEPEDTKPGSKPVPTPPPKKGWIGTGLGCLALILGCGVALFLGLAYGLGHPGSGNDVFQAVLVGAPILTLILGACWVAFRHRAGFFP